jgi:hypothetical protein
VDIDGNNAFQIKAIGVVISTFETLPTKETSLWGNDKTDRLPKGKYASPAGVRISYRAGTPLQLVFAFLTAPVK